MTTTITDKNNLRNKVQREFTKAGTVDAGRSEAELEKFSVARNIRVEKAWPKPAYIFKRSIAASDSDPNATQPSATDVWNLEGFSGLHGYIKFDGGTTPSATIELWVKDEQNQEFFLVDTKAAVGANAEFHFSEKVRSRSVYLRVTNILGTPTSATLRCSAE